MTDTTQNKRPLERKSAEQFKFMDSKAFWLVFVLILFSLPVIFSFKKINKKPLPEMPVLGQIDEFNLLNQNARKISSKDFAGSVLLVNFIFTRCPDTCPMITQQMAKVQRRLKGTAKSVQLLSISVDPEYDRPEVLKRYAQKHNADKGIWTFATGTPDEIQNLVVKGFKQAFDRGQHQREDDSDRELNNIAAMMEITHSENFVLVDQVGQIRAFKQLNTEQDINAIIRDLAILVNTRPPQRKEHFDASITAPAR